MAMAAAGRGKRNGRQPGSNSDSQAVNEVTREASAGATMSDKSNPAEVDGSRTGYPQPRTALLTKTGSRIDPSSLIFDPDWYEHEYPDVAAASLDPVRHYFDNGFREGRNPNQHFDTKWYASNNPDVAAAGLNPFLHYLLYGAREGRRPGP